MADTRFTLTQTTDILAAVDGLPPSARDTLHRRLRIFATKEIIPTVAADTGKAERLLDTRGVCAARILSVLVDMGFDSAVLRDVRDAFDFWDTEAETTELDLAISGVDVTLRIELLQTETGRKRLVARFEGIRPPASDRATPVIQALRFASREEVQAVTSVDVTKLLRPVLARLA